MFKVKYNWEHMKEIKTFGAIGNKQKLDSGELV